MTQFLRQSTAATVTIGPILDSAGAEYTGAVIGDISIRKHDGTSSAALASAATLTHDANGMYKLVLTMGNTDTLGRADFHCNKSTYQMPPKCYDVVPAMIYDSLVLGSDRLDTNVTHIADQSQTARDIGASVLVGDKTGFSLSAGGVLAIWDALTSALTTSGSVGKYIVDSFTSALSRIPAALQDGLMKSIKMADSSIRYVAASGGNDSNSGYLRSAPKATRSAVAALMVPYDTMVCIAGTYTGQFANALDCVTIQGDGSAATIFEASSTYGAANAGVLTNTGDHFTLRNLAVHVTGGSGKAIFDDHTVGSSYDALNVSGLSDATYAYGSKALRISRTQASSLWDVLTSNASQTIIDQCWVTGDGSASTDIPTRGINSFAASQLLVANTWVAMDRSVAADSISPTVGISGDTSTIAIQDSHIAVTASGVSAACKNIGVSGYTVGTKAHVEGTTFAVTAGTSSGAAYDADGSLTGSAIVLDGCAIPGTINGPTNVRIIDGAMDWSRTRNPTSSLGLTNTTISTSQQVAGVTGAVGSIGTGGIAAASFAAGAIDSAAIATDAIDAAAVKADAVTKIQSGLASQTSVDDLPTNAELATALAAADDATIAAIAALPTAAQNASTLLATSNGGATVGAELVAAWVQAYGKWSLNTGTGILSLYGPDGTTVVRSFLISPDTELPTSRVPQ